MQMQLSSRCAIPTLVRPWHTSIPFLWPLVQRTPRYDDAAQQACHMAQSHL